MKKADGVLVALQRWIRDDSSEALYHVRQSGFTDGQMEKMRARRQGRHRNKRKCRVCPFVTNDVRLLANHESYHANPKFRCRVCHALFPSISPCLKHLKATCK